MSVFIDEHQLPVARKSSNIYDMFVTAEFYTKMIIQFCKRTSFNQLNPTDQYEILKSFVFYIKMIRYAYRFDFEQGGFPIVMVRIIYNLLKTFIN